jgi:hypothetical protein
MAGSKCLVLVRLDVNITRGDARGPIGFDELFECLPNSVPIDLRNSSAPDDKQRNVELISIRTITLVVHQKSDFFMPRHKQVGVISSHTIPPT